MVDSDGDGCISRAEVKNFMDDQRGMFMMVAQQALASAGNTKQQMQVIKQVQQALANAEGDLSLKVMMQSMDWLRGGIDEATFLSKFVPFAREQRNSSDIAGMVEKLAAGAKDLRGLAPHMISAVQFINSEPGKAMLTKVLKALNSKTSELMPEIGRQIFKMLDVDGSGKVTSREVTAMKALMDAFLRVGSVNIGDWSLYPDAEAKELKQMYPDLFVKKVGETDEDRVVREYKACVLAIYGVLDRNGDNTLTPDELSNFVSKLASFYANMIKIVFQGFIVAFEELATDVIEQGWAAAGLKGRTLTFEELKPMVAQVAQMAPMMMVMMSQ